MFFLNLLQFNDVTQCWQVFGNMQNALIKYRFTCKLHS